MQPKEKTNCIHYPIQDIKIIFARNIFWRLEICITAHCTEEQYQFAALFSASATCKLSQIACEHRPAKQVSCPPGHVIDVIDGFYGRKDHST